MRRKGPAEAKLLPGGLQPGHARHGNEAAAYPACSWHVIQRVPVGNPFYKHKCDLLIHE